MIDDNQKIPLAPASAQKAEAFGGHSLSPARERLRSFGIHLPRNWVGQKLNSVVRDISTLGTTEPYDVEVFPGEYARLYPTGNRCEKRALCGVQFWDFEERMFLAAQIRQAEKFAPFAFVDAGANVGLYSLFARSVARACEVSDFHLVCIEPDEVNAQRLMFNLGQGVFGKTDIACVALGDANGFSALTSGGKNRGEIRVDDTRAHGKKTRMLSLAALSDKLNLKQIDVLKIDVEGYEEKVLWPFFGNAAKSLWPRTIIIETMVPGEASPAIQTCFNAGYELVSWTHINAILALPGAAPGWVT